MHLIHKSQAPEYSIHKTNSNVDCQMKKMNSTQARGPRDHKKNTHHQETTKIARGKNKTTRMKQWRGAGRLYT